MLPIFTYQKQMKMTGTENLKVGDFIQGQYKFGCISGVVVKVLKNIVVINKCDMCYETGTRTGIEINVTKSRITEINNSQIKIL